MVRRRPTSRAQSVKAKLAQNPGAGVESVISPLEIDETCRALRHTWRARVFTPLVTLWTFLVQVLHAGASCRKAVARVLTFLSTTRGLDASHDPSAYCQARKRLPAELLPRLTRTVGDKLAAKVDNADLWHGHRIKLVDGSSAAMPDTEDNQAAYPQPTSQKPG